MHWHLGQHHGQLHCLWKLSPLVSRTSIHILSKRKHRRLITTNLQHRRVTVYGVLQTEEVATVPSLRVIPRRVCRVSSHGSAIPDAEGISGWHQTPSSTRMHARPLSNVHSPFPRPPRHQTPQTSLTSKSSPSNHYHDHGSNEIGAARTS